MDHWLDHEGERAFDVVDAIWQGLGSDPVRLVAQLTAVLAGGAHTDLQKQDALRMVQELSYGHEGFARALMKQNAAKALLQLARDGDERLQHLACKALQNVSWWKAHAKPLLDAGTFPVLVRLLESSSPSALNAKLRTAALSTLANITDHDARHCQALLALKKLEWWLQFLGDGQAPEIKIAALNLIESVAKNVPSLRQRKVSGALLICFVFIGMQLHEAGAITMVCRVLQEARSNRRAEDEDIVSAAIDCLEEVCAEPENKALVLSLLGVTQLADAALVHSASASRPASPSQRKRARRSKSMSAIDPQSTAPLVSTTLSKGVGTRTHPHVARRGAAAQQTQQEQRGGDGGGVD